MYVTESCCLSIQLANQEHTVLILKWAISPGSFAPILCSCAGKSQWECGCTCPVTHEQGVQCNQSILLQLCICSSDRNREDMDFSPFFSAAISSVVCMLSPSVPWLWVQHTLTVHVQLSFLWSNQKFWKSGEVIFSIQIQFPDGGRWHAWHKMAISQTQGTGTGQRI